MGSATPGRDSQWQGGRTPVPMATGGRTPAWGAGGSTARSWSHTPTFSIPTNISQHQPGPPTPQQPEPPCGAKTPMAPTAVAAHRPTTLAAMALGPSTPTRTVAALLTHMAAPHPTVVLREEEAVPQPGTPPPHPPHTHTTHSPPAHPLMNPRTAAHPLPLTLLLKTQDLMTRLHLGRISQQRRRQRHIRVTGMRAVRLRL